jgi:hypothetical protein
LRGARLLATAGAMTTLQSCSGIDGCADDVKSRSTSPDGARVAIVFERGCGATTEESTQISIVDAAATKVTGKGNVAIIRGASHSSVEWTDATHLIVQLAADSAAQVVSKQQIVNGVTITFR